MNILIYVAMFGWIPVILVIFSMMRPHRALITSFVVGWLYLPRVEFPISGLPNYDKVLATTGGVLLGALIFDAGRLFSFRFRWYDLPMLAWCFAPIPSVLSVGVDLYEGISGTIRQVASWGLPYYLGRVYLDSLPNLRDMAVGIILGGLSYAPLCLYEVRFGPNLNELVYGFSVTAHEGMRYNGYRPRVFTANGLECGMWFTLVMMVAYQSWARGSITRIGRYPFWVMVVVLGVITILCKATGAFALLILGLGTLWLARATKSTWPIWILVCLPFLYVGSRASGVLSEEYVIKAASLLTNSERLHSLGFRLACENQLMEKAGQKWLFGWGLAGRGRIVSPTGVDLVITDSLWIIAYGEMGLFAVFAVFASFNVPVVVLLRRNPISAWSDPEMAPAAALAIIIALYSLDNLSNSMPSPIYPLIAGGVSALPAFVPTNRRSPLALRREMADRLAAIGRTHEAVAAYHEAIAAASMFAGNAASYRDLAEAHARLADALEMARAFAEAEVERRAALEYWEALAGVAGAPVEAQRGLAIALDELARNLAEQGRGAESVEYRRRSVAAFAELAPASRDDHERWALALNDLAWALATSDDPAIIDPEQAVLLAERATIESRTTGGYWNTLGVAFYRAGNDLAAIDALDRSIKLGPPGGTAFDLLFRAMALFRLGEESEGLDSLARGIAWADRNQPDHPGLARFRAEAQAYLSEIVDRQAAVEQG